MNIRMDEKQHFFKGIYNDETRVPLIAYKNKINDVNIDICCNNVLGYINSQMIETYSNIFSIVKSLGILIKVWAKANKI